MHITKHTLTLATTHSNSSTGIYFYGYGLPNGLVHAVEYEKGNVPSTGLISLYVKPDTIHDPYMLNADCESATPPYLEGETDDAQGSCTFARSGDFARSGSFSYKCIKTVAAGTGAASYFHNHTLATTNDMAGLLCGHTYTTSLWLYIPAASGIQGTEIGVELADYVGSWGTTDVMASNVYDAWQQITCTRTIRAKATGVLVSFIVASTAALNEYFYVDDIDFRHIMHRQILTKAASADSWIVFPRQGAVDSTAALIGATTNYENGMFVVRETDTFMAGITGGTSAATTGALHVYVQG